MFYSHELLTNRQYGVATIWLVATLGSKSTLKKVTRKAILDVDIPKACDTITNPDAPLALRLQASLLYGVSRVHFQQCNYVLTDTQSFRDKMRGIAQVMKELELDPEVGRTRPEQLNLPEDPGFLPDLDLTFDLSAFDLPSDGRSSRASSVLSSQFALSSQTSHLGVDLEEETDVQLELPTIDTPSGFGGMSIGGRTSVGRESVIHAAPDILNEESPFIDDAEFEIAADGSLVAVERPQSVQHQSRAGSVIGEGRAVSESGFSARVRDEHEAGAAGLEELRPNVDDEGLLYMGDDYDPRLPSPAPGLPGDPLDNQGAEDPAMQGVAEEERPQNVSSETAAASERRARPRKQLQIDQRTELQNKDLGDWNTHYLDNMTQLSQAKQSKATAQGKKNAAFWILGQGIGGVQANFGEDREPHPLSVFSGQSLLDALVGPDAQRSPSSSKRARSSSPSDKDDRRVRARNDEGDDMTRGVAEGQIVGFNDEEIMGQGEEFNPESEVGRRAGSSLADVVSVLPWNRSASRQGSAQPLIGAGLGISSSMGVPGSGMKFGPGNVMAGMRSRMASSSPLGGKGRQLMDLGDLKGLAGQNTTGEDDAGMMDMEAYEQYGPAAAVDTQTAAQSQWMRNTLESEAQNFLGFVEAQLIETGENGLLAESVTLDQLLPPEDNSGVVAAQALLHVLALTTKGLLRVEQEEEFGDIVLKVVHVEDKGKGQAGEGAGQTGDDDQDSYLAPGIVEGDSDEEDEAHEL